jgi:DNA-binding transcriptional ArsR family regulator
MAQSQLAAIGALLANDTRAGILTVLMDGRAHTGGELARHLGVSPSTASEHLSKLLDAGLVSIEAQGRHRYFRLAGLEIAQLLETIGAASTPPLPTPASRAPAALTFARTCYDHLAGELAVHIYDQLTAEGHLVDVDHHLQLTGSGVRLLKDIGVNVDSIKTGRRPTVRKCLDWTERRHHLAGATGAALLQLLLERGWATRGRQPRSIRITQAGKAAIAAHFSYPRPAEPAKEVDFGERTQTDSSLLFQLLGGLKLPLGDYAVFGSGPLVVRGIISAANDLDVLCRGAAWERAMQLGNLVYLAEHDVSVVTLHDDGITLGNRWAIGDFDVDHLIDTAEVIDNLPFVKIEHVIAYKKLAGRPKDLDHLRLIDSYQRSAP